MKSSFYLKHDLDARDDYKMRAMLMKFGTSGYGIYWMIAEDLYRNHGRIARDYSAMSWAYHEPAKNIKAIVETFDLFYDDGGKIACHRVDRDIEDRKSSAEEGRSSIMKRKRADGSPWVKDRDLVGSNKPPHTRRGEEGEDRIEQPHDAPSAVDKLISGIDTSIPKDYFTWRFPKGFNAKYAGAYVLNVPVDECRKLLNTPRLGAEIRTAIEWKIAQHKAETHR